MSQGFGSFMEGLQSGIGTGQSIRRQGQLDKIYDSGIRKIENDEKISALEMEDAIANGDAAEGFGFSDFALEDPYILRFMQKLKGGGKPTKSALPIEGSPAQSLGAQAYPMGEEPEEFEPIPFADGGKVDEEKEREKARAARYQATPGQVASSAGNVTGALAMAGPRGARGALHGAADFLDKGTDDPIDGGGRGRTMAFLENVIDTPRVAAASALRGLADLGGGPAGGAPAPQAPALSGVRAGHSSAPQAAPAMEGVKSGHSSSVRSSVRASGGSALPVSKGKPAAPEQVDFSNMDPLEVPDYKTRDWQQFRQQAVRGAIARGTPYADAVDKVDQQVMSMQMRGFQNFAQQGMALQQQGNLKAAAAAYRAAFQYMPTTSDVKFSIVQGNLVAYGVDEETGQPETRPWLMNPEMLSSMMKNFSSPGAWAEHAMDRQRIGIAEDEIDFRNRRLDEYEKPVGFANAAANQTSAAASVLNAHSNMARAVRSGGDDGASASENLAGDKDVRDVIAEYAMAANEDGDPAYPQLQDPAIQKALGAKVAEIRRQTGSPSEAILEHILQRALSGK